MRIVKMYFGLTIFFSALLTEIFSYSIFLKTNNDYERIIGGIDTTIDKRPYQVSLQFHRENRIEHVCGASIISTKYLLSAAHCYPGDNLPFLYARVGSTAYNTGGQLFKINTVVIHEKFDFLSLDYDFSILSLLPGQEIQLGPNIGIIELPTLNQADPADGSLVTASGWGQISDSNTQLPINLQEVGLPVVNRKVCERTYEYLSKRQFCVGGTKEGNLNICTGDSGGPAVQNGILYGVASFVSIEGCQYPIEPGVFAAVATVRDWINEKTGV